MPRATNGPASRNRRRRVLFKTKGFRGNRSRLYRYAKDALYKAQTWAYRDRKNRKRTFRNLWVSRINAACRNGGLSYNRFIEGLKFLNVHLDRKTLSEMAINDSKAFEELIAQAKHALTEKAKAAQKSA
jgi:large subunit ribosomal protein L20